MKKIDLEPIVQDVLQHAAEEAPQECCGVAVVTKGKLRYWRCKNISQNEATFEIDPEDYARAEDAGEIVAICHSHVFVPPIPSEVDKVMMEKTKLPWLIVNIPTLAHGVHYPSGYQAPLVGRPYHHGVLDCYQIIVDYYKRELGIELPHFERGDDWWNRGQSLYLDGFGKAGFVCVGDGTHRDIRKHDVLLMQAASPVPNHAAVYLGDNVLLQHVAGRLSSRDVFGGYWRQVTTHVLRRKEFA